MNCRKCFLLGAGATLGYKSTFGNRRERPPGSFEFFSRGSELNLFDEDLFPDLRSIVDRYASENDNRSDMEYDIEKVMTYAIENLDMKSYGQLVYYIYTLFRHYSRDYNPRGLDNYQKLAKYYRDTKYSVVSLNYDTIFEQALESRGLTPTYDYQYSRYQVPIAKLHGSINTINKIPCDVLDLGSDFHNVVDHMYRVEINNTIVERGEHEVPRPDTSYMVADEVKEISCQDLLFRGDDHFQIALAPPVGKNKLNEK